jgi:hypothetical protein
MRVSVSENFKIWRIGFLFFRIKKSSGGEGRCSGYSLGSFARFFNSANARPARRPSLVAVESSSSAWSVQCGEPAAESSELIRRQLGNSFGDFFDFHGAPALSTAWTGDAGSGVASRECSGHPSGRWPSQQ